VRHSHRKLRQFVASGQFANVNSYAPGSDWAAYMRRPASTASVAVEPVMSALAIAGSHTSSAMRTLRMGVFPVAGLGTR